MRTALVAFSCMAVFLLVMATRGAGDWSRSLTIAMYGLASASFVLGLGGVSIAVYGRVPDHQRGLVLLLSVLPVLVGIGFGLLVLVIVTTPLD
jgi:hypothetical protein